MTVRKKSPGSRREGLSALAPEEQAALEAQIAQAAQALEEGRDLEVLTGLVTLQTDHPHWDLHLLDGLGQLNHPAIPPLLAALFGDTPDKTRQKALKRTLHHLKTRGVPVPEDLLRRAEAGLQLLAQAVPCDAYLSPPHGSGERFVILEGPTAILGGNLLVSRISDRQGFLECHLLPLSRKLKAQFWEDMKVQGLDLWASPPGPYAVRLLEETHALNPQAGEGAKFYAALREKIYQGWGRPEEAPALEDLLPPLEPGQRHSLLGQAEELALDELFTSWLPSPADIAPWFEKFLKADESPLVLSEQQSRGRVEGILNDAVHALFSPETRPLWARRLLETAYYLDLLGEEEFARVVQAAGEDLRTGVWGPLTGENPFLKGLVKLPLRFSYKLFKEAKDREAPDLLTPPSTDSLIIRR